MNYLLKIGSLLLLIFIASCKPAPPQTNIDESTEQYPIEGNGRKADSVARQPTTNEQIPQNETKSSNPQGNVKQRENDSL